MQQHFFVAETEYVEACLVQPLRVQGIFGLLVIMDVAIDLP
jgi:hypothetical protein